MNHPELLQKLTSAQTSLWPLVTNTMGEQCELMVQINSPLVLEVPVDNLVQEFSTPSLLVQFAFSQQRDSMQTLVLPLDTASALLTAMGKETADFDEESIETVRPAMDALVQGICLGVGNMKNEVVAATDLRLRLGRFNPPSGLPIGENLVRIQLAFGVDSTIGSLTWIVDSSVAHFVSGLEIPVATGSSAADVPFSSLPPFGASRVGEESHGLDILMDIPLDISVELGRTRLVVKEVVDLGVGSIVEIEKAAGEPVDILVNGRLVAYGEVVVIEDNFGVRITEILNPQERIARLGEAA